MSEDGGRIPAGPRGQQGERGERGERGLSRLQGRAVVVLFLLAVFPGAAGWFWWVHQADVNAAAQRQEQLSQQRQGELLEDKLCTTFGKLASLKPPAGNPATNPSRAFDQNQHALLVQLGPDLGCKQGR
jgi:hypothetical protein